jgi:hypothetical protein
MTAPPTPAAPKHARAALAVGLLGVMVGVFVGLGEWMPDLEFMTRAESVPYVLGAVTIGAGPTAAGHCFRPRDLCV